MSDIEIAIGKCKEAYFRAYRLHHYCPVNS
jgi:hypothetical protein